MLATLRTALITPLPSSSCSHRLFSSTRLVALPRRPSRFTGNSTEDADEDKDERVPKRRRDAMAAGEFSGPDPSKWLQGPGLKYKDAFGGGEGKWLGTTGPFPMNPTFQPSPPITSRERLDLYLDYMKDPTPLRLHMMAERHNLSLKRLDAIIRLTHLERSWPKKLQTGFQKGMEMITSRSYLSTRRAVKRTKDDAPWVDEDAEQGKDRYQRLYWETVGSGEQPIVDEALERAKEMAEKARRVVSERTPVSKLPSRRPDGSQSTSPTASAIVFRDFGNKFSKPKRTHS